MLELKMVKESLFPKVLEAILDLVDVASVDFSSKGLKLQAVDPELIAIITLLFPDKDFHYYSCDKYLTMGIAIDDMVKAIRAADEDDTITIKIGDENFDSITLSVESPKKKTTTYYLRVVDANIQRFQIPNWQAMESKYQAFVPMPSAEFVRVCKYLSNICGDGEISVTEKGLEFYALGESGYLKIKYMQPEVMMRAPVSMTLNLKYMNCFARASTLFKEVKICLSTNHPLMVECKIGKMGYIRYFVVPRVIPEIEEEEMKESETKMLRDGKDEEDEIEEEEMKENETKMLSDGKDEEDEIKESKTEILKRDGKDEEDDWMRSKKVRQRY